MSSAVLPSKSVIVTGGAGFLGSHLCQKLISQGQQVYCVDNLHTGSLHNIESLLDHSQFLFIEANINEPLLEKFSQKHIDQIYNLACPASPQHYQQDPILTTITSVQGTANVLQLAKMKKAQFLQASTSEIYGDPLVHPQHEDYRGNVNTLGVRACYNEGKRCAESLVMDFQRMYDLDVKIIRIFNTFGPQMWADDGRVISNFIVQALRGEDIEVHGEGGQTRSFCYVDDLTDGMYTYMNMPDKNPGPINLGSDHEISVFELAQTIIKLTQSQSRIVHVPLPSDDPKRRCPDLSRAQEVLGWSPQVPFKQGLLKTIEYFRKFI